MRIFFSNKEINLKNSLNQYEKITCQILIVVVFQCIKHNLGHFFKTKNVPKLRNSGLGGRTEQNWYLYG